MKKLPQIIGILAATLFGFVASSRGGDAPASLTLEASREPTAWTFLYQGRKVMVYSFAPKQFSGTSKSFILFRVSMSFGTLRTIICITTG